MTKTLAHNDLIRIASWADNVSATVFTTRGYALENGRNADDLEARARANGHDLVSSIYSSGALVGDRKLARKLVEIELARAAAATVLAAGEEVEIEGRRYVVVVVRGNGGSYPVNCDPIHFRPV